MRLVQVAIGNVNTTVGAIRSNTDRALALARAMADAGSTVGVFPEQTIGGYPPEDLVQWRAFVDAQRDALHHFAKETAASSMVFLMGLVVGVGGDLFNVAATVHGGKILGFTPKEKLPLYNVFYEGRTLSRGSPGLLLDAGGVPLGDLLFSFDFGTLSAEVCEDLWSPDGPTRRRAFAGAELVCNLSASPFRASTVNTRRELCATRSADNQIALVYANLIGANDGLVFDGGGFVYQNGRPLCETPRFREGIATTVLDLDRTTRLRREATTWRSDLDEARKAPRQPHLVCSREPTARRTALRFPPPPAGTSFFLPAATAEAISPRQALLDETLDALTLGVADYYAKTGAFRGIGLALSGGRDSALTLLIAAEARRLLKSRGHDPFLRVFYMPSEFSSSETATAAAQLAQEVGAEFLTVPIQSAFQHELAAQVSMLSRDEHPSELSRQNTQARIRGSRMWNWANTTGALFLQTGNMSEKALGYTTVGGDLEGCLSVIANLPKTVVVALLERLSEKTGHAGIQATLATTAGPELAPHQSGESELMPFAVLDACLYLYVAEKLSVEEVSSALESAFPDLEPASLHTFAEKFARLFTASVFKWVRAPISLHLGTLDLDRERALQLPVVQRKEWE